MRVSLLVGALALALGPALTSAQTPPGLAPSLDQQATSGSTKRTECEASTQARKGQNKRDQVQLCLAQARIGCLKQAVDQKMFGKQRTDFVKSCMGEQPAK
jgi:hypothetical protein